MAALIRRRRLLAAMGAAWAGLTAPRLVFAQAAARIANVTVLYAGDSDDDEPTVRPFFEQMARLGWTEGKNVAYDRQSGKGTRQYLSTMASLAAGREPDLIYATTTTLALAVLKETTSVPVLFATAADPVAAGLVASISKPGRNATGAFLVQEEASAKRFALLRQVMPKAKRIGVVFDRATPDLVKRKAAHAKTAHAAGFELVGAEFTNFEAIAKILAQFKRDGLPAAEITPSFALIGRRREVATLAERNGIALVAHRAEWAEAGAVLTYGPDVGESHRRAAGLADRLLKGAKPAELPVERVYKVEVAVNTRAADALGLHIPQSLLRSADKVFT